MSDRKPESEIKRRKPRGGPVSVEADMPAPVRRAWPGWEPCETCGGTGWIGVHDDWPHTSNHGRGCPDCASGFVPPGWQVEAAAEALYRLLPGGNELDWEHAARAALVAASKAEREERG